MSIKAIGAAVTLIAGLAGLWVTLGFPMIVTDASLEKKLAPLRADISKLEKNDQELAESVLEITICIIRPECDPDLSRMEEWQERLDEISAREGG